ncbi:class IV adenylate cyclase [Herbaspirillum sp. SJZ099]|uniref:class IV adenylate cyclase n=1 Tax=Herbaspirillum sp. SJZ099 TaxID=2572916 RepID=UPI0011A5F3DC|nr:class IV adenylate cyclase [Herbaspirillum sp. SJZ099]TWC69522.1 adenylate cyclase [Herbaspirillum sp. SJZ099]
MSRNVEIKARMPGIQAILHKVKGIADQGPIEIAQDDTFFRCDAGRLKLRQFSADKGELIFYRRANQAGPKESFFVRTATAEPAVLREALSLAYGESGRVIKQRTLFHAGRTRIHLDRVQGLGEFVELEVVLSDGDAIEDGIREAEDIMQKLGIEPAQLIESAYVDLLGMAPAGA